MSVVYAKGAFVKFHPQTGEPRAFRAGEPVNKDDDFVRMSPQDFESESPMATATARPGQRR